MNSDTALIDKQLNFSIKVYWIILASIVLLLVFQSCNSIQSPRSSRAKISNKQATTAKVDNKAVAKEESSVSEIENFINNIENNKNQAQQSESARNQQQKQANYAKESAESRLPTIREQMQNLAKDQESIKRNVSELQDDVSDIKNSLNQIKNAVSAPKNASNTYANQTDNVKPGIDNSYKGNECEYESNLGTTPANDEGDYIKSDEALVKEKTEKKARPNVVIKPTTPAPKKNISSNTKIKKIVNNTTKQKLPTTNIEANNVPAATKIQSPATASVSTEEAVNLALKSFAKQDYQTSINELNKIMSRNKDAQSQAVSCYWIGESYFRMGKYSDALRFFEKTLAAGVNIKKEEAKIMTAESYLRLGNTKDAKLNFRQFIESYPKSRYLPRAKKLLQQI